MRTQFLELQRNKTPRKKLRESIDRLRRASSASEDAVCAAKVREFEQMTPKEQYDTVRFHGKNRPFCESPAVNAALKDVKVLPDNMDSFRLTSNEAALCKEDQKLSLLEKNSEVIVVEEPLVLHQKMLRHLEEYAKVPHIQLIIALMFVSGRRSTEILNQRSTFDAVDGFPYHCHFVGQLKKHSTKPCDEVFMIPLLCEFALFSRALDHFRQTDRQRVVRDQRDTNKQVAKVYTSQLHYGQKRHLPFLKKMHDLRGLYVRYVDAMFRHGVTINLLCKLVLGHDDMTESLHYFNLQIDCVDEKFADLGIDHFPQYDVIKRRLALRKGAAKA